MEKYILQANQTEKEVLKLRQNDPAWHHFKTTVS